jgi:hypothetical protein
MCKVDIREYSCSCVKEERFHQCAANQNTNVRCEPVRKNKHPKSKHMCLKRMVKPNTDPMHR